MRVGSVISCWSPNKSEILHKWRVSLNNIVKRPGYNLNHLEDNIQDEGNLIFQEMIGNIRLNQSKSKEVYTM